MRNNQVIKNVKTHEASNTRNTSQVIKFYSLEQKKNMLNLEKTKEKVKLAASQLEW